MSNQKAYKNSSFGEAPLRMDFFDPLFKEALGWGVHNEAGRPEAYRDAVYEDRVKVRGGTKAPTTASTPAETVNSSWRRYSATGSSI